MDLYPVYHLYFRNIILSFLQAPHMTRSPIHCGVMCSMKTSCYSFFYNNVNHDCYLVDGFVQTSTGGSGTEVKNNIDYFADPRKVSPCRLDLGFQLETSVNICYKPHWETPDFIPGRAVCQEEGGDLATVKTPQIENFYITLLNTYGTDMFFGATDAGSPGVWRWLDGTLWSAFSVSIADKHCLEYDNYGFMDADYCENKPRGFVCETVLPPKYE